MAEGESTQRSFKDSFSIGSGDADETFCEPCISSGKWIVVEGYCQICKEFLCANCLVVHKNQKMTKGHIILNRDQMPKGPGSSSNQDLCVEVCETHHPEIVKFYCKAHDETGCGDCMTLKHATCRKERVQDISNGFQASKEFKVIQQKLEKFHKELEVLQGTLDDKKNWKNLEAIYSITQQKITAFRKQVNDYLDQIEKDVKDEVERYRTDDETEMKRIIAENVTVKSGIEDILQQIQSNSDVNENSIFVITKQAKQRLDAMEYDIGQIEESLKQQQQQQDLEFRPSKHLEELLSAKTPLGKLFRRPNIHTTVTYSGNINVRTNIDKKNCWINDCILLSPDRLVVTDGENENIKVLDNISVLSTYSTSSEPFGLVALSTDQIVVSLPREGKLALFHVTSTTTPTITKIDEIQVKNDCHGIAYKDEKLAISYIYPGSMDIIDMHGKIQHTIQPKEYKANVLQGPYSIEFGQDKDTLIASDSWANKVRVITFEGKILRTYTSDKLEDSSGLAITGDGVLFVCSVNGTVHAVSPDFKTNRIIINDDRHVVNPNSITYCDINHRLYISSNSIGGDKNNSVHVYDLNV